MRNMTLRFIALMVPFLAMTLADSEKSARAQGLVLPNVGIRLEGALRADGGCTPRIRRSDAGYVPGRRQSTGDA